MWDWNFTMDILPAIGKGIWITIVATFGAFIVALALGMLIVLAKRSSFKPLALVVGGLVEFIRSTPLLVQLFFFFYVAPEYGLTFPPFVVGVFTLGLHYSTYLSEVYRAGIEAIPKGQWEAAKALNLSRIKTWKSVIIPQAIPPIVPLLGGYLIVMFKETPLLSAITVVDMMQTAKIIGSQTFRYLEPFTIVGLLFLIISYPTSVFFRRLEKKLNVNTNNNQRAVLHTEGKWATSGATTSSSGNQS